MPTPSFLSDGMFHQTDHFSLAPRLSAPGYAGFSHRFRWVSGRSEFEANQDGIKGAPILESATGFADALDRDEMVIPAIQELKGDRGRGCSAESRLYVHPASFPVLPRPDLFFCPLLCSAKASETITHAFGRIKSPDRGRFQPFPRPLVSLFPFFGDLSRVGTVQTASDVLKPKLFHRWSWNPVPVFSFPDNVVLEPDVSQFVRASARSHRLHLWRAMLAETVRTYGQAKHLLP